MSLENAKKFIAQIQEDETLQERTANQGEEEVMAIAKEIGLDFTADELKAAAGSQELDLTNLEKVAGGKRKMTGIRKTLGTRETGCPADPDGKHNWVVVDHTENEWFGWIKDGGLWSFGTDYLKCTKCGQNLRRSS